MAISISRRVYYYYYYCCYWAGHTKRKAEMIVGKP